MRDIFIPLLIGNLFKLLLRATFPYWGWETDILLPFSFLLIYLVCKRKYVAYFFASLGIATHELWFEPISLKFKLAYIQSGFLPFEAFTISLLFFLIMHALFKGAGWGYRRCVIKLAREKTKGII